MLIEIAPHVQDEAPGRFEELLHALKLLGYDLEAARSGRRLSMSAAALRHYIGDGASTDAQALARGSGAGTVSAEAVVADVVPTLVDVAP